MNRDENTESQPSPPSGESYYGVDVPPGISIRYEDGTRIIRRSLGTRGGRDIYGESRAPDAISHPYDQNERDSPIVLHAGVFRFAPDDRPREVEGHVVLKWRPIPELEAFGQFIAVTPLQDILEMGESVGTDTWTPKPWIDLVEPAQLPTIPEGEAQSPVAPRPTPTHGTAGPEALRDVFFRKTEEVEWISFAIPNGWEALDTSLISDPKRPWILYNGRFQSEVAPNLRITIDTYGDHRRRLKDLARFGGIHLTHLGRLETGDGSKLTLETSLETFETLRIGLNLACGRRLDVVLPCGHSNDGLKSIWWNTPRVDDYRTAYSLLDSSTSSNQLREIICKTFDYCQTQPRKSMLRQAVAYYVRSNRGSNLEIETAQIVSALQLVSYFRLVTEGSFSSRQWKALETEGQIQRLLQDCQIDTLVSPTWPMLAGVGANLPNATSDALAILIKMRNIVIHPSRDTPDQWSHYEWYEAWSTGKEYMTLVLLNTIGYEGKFRSLMEPNKAQGVLSKPPWLPPS